MAKRPDLKFKDGWDSGLVFNPPDLSKAAREKLKSEEIWQAILEGARLSKKGVDKLDYILEPKKKKDKQNRWENDLQAPTFFGRKNDIKVSQIKTVRRRLNREKKRLNNNVLHIGVKPQPMDHPTRYGRNRGAFFSPNGFEIYTHFFDFGATDNGAHIIHELLHDVLTDKKIDGEWAYDEDQVKKLARQHPSKARRNPGNYQHFCLNCP